MEAINKLYPVLLIPFLTKGIKSTFIEYLRGYCISVGLIIYLFIALNQCFIK